MQNSNTYKLYKSGKLWVIGAVAVAGVAVSANTTQVSADTVSNADAQAVKTTDATQNDKQFQLTASSADTATDKATTDEATKSATVSSTAEKSTVPTTAGTSVTQDQAKDAVDKAQDTVKDDAKTASNAGVDVTTGKTTDVTINDDNASSKTNEVLSDLNKKDQAVKDATAKQQANDRAYQTATTEQTDATKQGQADLDNATSELDKQVDTSEKAGIKVNVEVAQSSPEYKDLSGLEGQDLLDAMAYNINLYKQAIADGVSSEKADTETLAKLTAEYQQKQADYAKANADRDEAVEKGQSDLNNATSGLDNQVEASKNAGLDVSVEVSKVSPKYKDLTGLEGQDLLDAMAYNLDLYNKAVASGVSTEKADTETLAKLTAEYQKQVADYEAQKAAVDKANADKKAAYEKALEDYMNGTNHTTSMTAQTQTDASSGQYQTFMNATVDNTTGEFTLEHDTNDGVHIIGHGVLKGKVNWKIVSNGDGTETVTISSIELYSYTYTNAYQNQAVNQNINFHVYDNDGNELFSVYYDGNTTFSKTINKTAQINKTFKISPNETSPLTQVLVVDDNWLWNTHGQVSTQIKNTNVAPKAPTYEQDPVKPTALKATVHHVQVVAPAKGQAPAVPVASVKKVTVADMPNADKPQPQKVEVHYYNIKKTPKVEKTETPKVVETASILPHTNANESHGGVLLSAMAGLASLGLAFGISKKGKKQN
ncbi:aggregation substance precursor [Leuconostoc mesenteroides subsp. mesenteroides]|uniref:KxYKxGKxW signal peptide domain-containing protein n=1 Tax=Leuconostoc mesenteroides TaxID=1245 RepID=UPI000A0614AC|nr:KxYKxGKxW signal peptide domain-containing protein [Leuconostoc mesenteroides]ARN63569.1 aggregation substance precursor [Leuconostoc mesenteroides subsp. mesenteroides]MDV8928515.1 KxYKxGKxW signal peptide domain-containing protein [Leuconostoc mesenteroides]ORI88499.1 aggregation substance precursor [Leuconostoc mesenteroides subsp. mesenteroides]ORI90983.1 aggregation substance precursor [Leuconostoc mesenteroides subsp. mesenteroides]